jgi:hypothetical protein
MGVLPQGDQIRSPLARSSDSNHGPPGRGGEPALPALEARRETMHFIGSTAPVKVKKNLGRPACSGYSADFVPNGSA